MSSESGHHGGGGGVDLMETNALVSGLARVVGVAGGVHEAPMVGAAPEEAQRHAKKNHKESNSHGGH